MGKPVKRTKNIHLLLIGGISSGALAGCAPGGPPVVTTESVYTNDYYVPGAGYYHAPFRMWYPRPYNFFDPATKRYFYGGQWGATAFESITNISSPLPHTAGYVEAVRTDVVRGGFGGSAGGYHGGFG